MCVDMYVARCLDTCVDTCVAGCTDMCDGTYIFRHAHACNTYTHRLVLTQAGAEVEQLFTSFRLV